MKAIYIILLLLFSTSLFSSEVESFFYFTNKSQYFEAQNLLKKNIYTSEIQKALKDYLEISQSGYFKNSEYYTISKKDTSLTHNIQLINKALYLYVKEGNTDNAFETLKQSLFIAKERDDPVLICLSLKYILEMYQRFHIASEDISFNYFIDEYKKYAYNTVEEQNYTLYKYRITQRYYFNQPEKVIPIHNEAFKKLSSIDLPFLKAKRDLTYFSYYQRIKKNIDSTEFYINEAFNSLKDIDGYFEQERYKATEINQSVLEYDKGNYKKALLLINKIDLNKDDYLYKLLKKFILYWKYKIHESLGNTELSLKLHNEYLQKELIDSEAKNLQNIAEYETKYQTAEKEKQLLEEQVKRKEEQAKTKQITIALTSTLFLGSIIAFLVYRNTKRKQRIAEQDRELQIQKTETILKEKELETINAMVSGQEKERLRLAGELHDNIGSTLATVRMQVENLERNLDKVDDPKALLQKANLLINETYEKVRGISHKSNSGVMAKEGLLPAVEKLARTVSTTNKLTIDVQDFGLENRIPNELEIIIFRIIQELVTNIVKHANATEANISLTQHDNELNIMVEDNGKGFKVGRLEEKDGMGLGTIERRVEHLEGTMEVDSTQGRGTSVSIDIPIQ